MPGEFFHGIESGLYFLLIPKRSFQEMTKHTTSHSRFRVIQYPKKGSPLLFLPKCLPQLQVSLTVAVHNHIVFILKILYFLNMRKQVLLRVIKIGKTASERSSKIRLVGKPEPHDRGLKMRRNQLIRFR